MASGFHLLLFTDDAILLPSSGVHLQLSLGQFAARREESGAKTKPVVSQKKVESLRISESCSQEREE